MDVETWITSKRVVSELDGLTYTRAHSSFNVHLRTHGLTYREYFEKYVSGTTQCCSYCGSEVAFRRATHVYAKSCADPVCNGKAISAAKQGRDEETRKRQNAASGRAIREMDPERKAEMMAKRRTTKEVVGEDGLDGYKRTARVGQQVKAERYGDAHYNNARKISASKQAHTVERKDEINRKRRATMKEVYGVENNFLREGVLKRQRSTNATFKEYTFPSGKVVAVRGYEPAALDVLLKDFDETAIIVCDGAKLQNIQVPVLEYRSLHRNILKYYPDIYIPSQNRIIEVKSRWWFDGLGERKYRSRLENNMRKRQAVVDAGYSFEFWVFDSSTEYEVIK